MTESLLQQARELSKISKRQHSDHYFALRGRFESFLDAAIEHLEAGKTLTLSVPNHQRTNTLALMAAILYAANPGDPMQSSVNEAENLMVVVERMSK